MGPKTSFWDIFSGEGRLKRLWAQALEEADPDVCLSRLREVQRRLQENPTAFAHLWIPFLEAFLDASRIPRLTDSDLAALEQMGQVLNNGPESQIRPEDVWFRVLVAYNGRGEERQARTLLARIYRSPSASWEEKTRCARELAYRGGSGDDFLGIYIDYMQYTTTPAVETHILAVLNSVCRVDFDTDRVRLKRAREVAQRLVTNRVPIPVTGLWAAIGLYSLLIDQAPTEASKYFGRALEIDRRDRTSLIGLIASWIRLGMHTNVLDAPRLLPTSDYSSDAIVMGLLQLSKIIQWLDSRDMPGPLPADAQRIEYLKTLGLNKYLGDLVDATWGRVYLLLGNARYAAELLRPLAARNPTQPRWNYYAAWAAMLTGDHDGVASCFTHAAQWSGRWTVACLLLDTDSTLAEKSGVGKFLQNTSQAQMKQSYLPLLEARLALARSIQPAVVTWENGSGYIEEDMEALRTLLGIAFYMHNTVAMERLVFHPLFSRLPLADQVFWRGLLVLRTKDQVQQGLVFLQQAATNLAYPRAALVLATYFLENNRLKEAKYYLELVTPLRTDGKVGLLRAYISLREGQTDTAIGHLEQLITQSPSTPKAHFALGNLLLQKAASTSLSGQPDRARRYREEAAGMLTAALKIGKEELPSHAEALAHCAQFIAYPQQRVKLHAFLWNDLAHLNSSQQPWIKWNAMLAQLWYGTTAEVMAADMELSTIIDSASRMEDATIEVFAQALAQVSKRVEQLDHADRLVQMLEHLSMRSELQTVKRTCQLGITSALQVRYRKTDGTQRNQIRQELMHHASLDQTNGTLALLLASVNLENSAKRAAITFLHNTQPQDEQLQSLCSCLAKLLEKQAPSHPILPRSDSIATPELKRGYDLLQVAAAFVANKPDKGYAALSLVLSEHPKEIVPLLKMDHLLPFLCAYWLKEHKGIVPPTVVETIHSLSLNGTNLEQTAVLARCSAAIGELEYACGLWEQSLANDQHTDTPLRQEYAKLLCHLAVTSYLSGNDREAVRRLRQAAHWLKESAIS